jgi:hypothetical protein
MPEEYNNNLPSQEEIEKNYKRLRPIATKIAKEAVLLANISQAPPSEEELINLGWKVYFTEEIQDIVLTIHLNPIFTRAVVHSSVGLVALHILRDIELLLSNPKAMKQLRVEELEREKVVFDKSLQLTRDYIEHLPLVIFHSFHQTLGESVINHIKKFVDYDLQDRLEKQDYPREKRTLLPNNDLNDIRRLFRETELPTLNYLGEIDTELSALRKKIFAERKVWLDSPEVFLKLPSDYNQLKIQYRNAKNEYKLEYAAFHRIKRQVDPDEWEVHWEKFYGETFPELLWGDEIETLSASQLAYLHLAKKFGFSPSYMEIIVRGAKAQLTEKASKNKKADTRT